MKLRFLTKEEVEVSHVPSYINSNIKLANTILNEKMSEDYLNAIRDGEQRFSVTTHLGTCTVSVKDIVLADDYTIKKGESHDVLKHGEVISLEWKRAITHAYALVKIGRWVTNPYVRVGNQHNLRLNDFEIIHESVKSGSSKSFFHAGNMNITIGNMVIEIYHQHRSENLFIVDDEEGVEYSIPKCHIEMPGESSLWIEAYHKSTLKSLTNVLYRAIKNHGTVDPNNQFISFEDEKILTHQHNLLEVISVLYQMKDIKNSIEESLMWEYLSGTSYDLSTSELKELTNEGRRIQESIEELSL